MYIDNEPIERKTKVQANLLGCKPKLMRKETNENKENVMPDTIASLSVGKSKSLTRQFAARSTLIPLGNQLDRTRV